MQSSQSVEENGLAIANRSQAQTDYKALGKKVLAYSIHKVEQLLIFYFIDPRREFLSWVEESVLSARNAFWKASGLEETSDEYEMVQNLEQLDEAKKIEAKNQIFALLQINLSYQTQNNSFNQAVNPAQMHLGFGNNQRNMEEMETRIDSDALFVHYLLLCLRTMDEEKRSRVKIEISLVIQNAQFN